MGLNIKHRVRSFIQDQLGRFGFTLARNDSDHRQSLDLLLLASAAALDRKDALVAVQVGANDGVTEDPIRGLLVSGAVRGILVEPVPATFDVLVRNYAGTTGVIFENAAIGPEDGQATLYVPGARAGDFSSRQASFDRQHLIRHGIADDAIDEVQVPTLSFETLLKKHAVTRLDILQIDVEGYDYHILRMALATGLRPRIIQFEHVHLSRGDKAAARRLLEDKGYVYLEAASDTLALDGAVAASLAIR